MKYKVTISRELFYSIEVEHENEEDASEIAEELFKTERHIFNMDRANETYEVIDVQEIKG